MVEALAAARATSFALEIGLSSVILEGDAQAAIKILNSEEESFSPFGHIRALAKHLTNTSRISCTHVRRIGNSIAHNLTS